MQKLHLWFTLLGGFEWAQKYKERTGFTVKFHGAMMDDTTDSSLKQYFNDFFHSVIVFEKSSSEHCIQSWRNWKWRHRQRSPTIFARVHFCFPSHFRLICICHSTKRKCKELFPRSHSCSRNFFNFKTEIVSLTPSSIFCFFFYQFCYHSYQSYTKLVFR